MKGKEKDDNAAAAVLLAMSIEDAVRDGSWSYAKIAAEEIVKIADDAMRIEKG